MPICPVATPTTHPQTYRLHTSFEATPAARFQSSRDPRYLQVCTHAACLQHSIRPCPSSRLHRTPRAPAPHASSPHRQRACRAHASMPPRRCTLRRVSSIPYIHVCTPASHLQSSRAPCHIPSSATRLQSSSSRLDASTSLQLTTRLQHSIPPRLHACIAPPELQSSIPYPLVGNAPPKLQSSRAHASMPPRRYTSNAPPDLHPSMRL